MNIAVVCICYVLSLHCFTHCAVSALGLSHLIPWKLDDFCQAITCLMITNDRRSAPPPIWWKRAMDSVTANLRSNSSHLVCETNCPPCISTAASVCLALTRVEPVDSLSPEAARIVAFLNSITYFMKTLFLETPVCPSEHHTTSSSSQGIYNWLIEFIVLMNHVISLVKSNGTTSSALLMNFVSRGGMPCISDFASALCQLSQHQRVNEGDSEKLQDVLSVCCEWYTTALSVTSASSASASPPTLQLICDVWPHACNRTSKAQKPALTLIALAVSLFGAEEIIGDLEFSETNLASIVEIIVSHIESSQMQPVPSDAEYQSKATRSACEVLCACLSVQPSLSVTIIPRHILPKMCTFGWTWTHSAVCPHTIDSFSSMVMMALRPTVAALASHVFGDVLHLENKSPWLTLVIMLLEINASHISDIFSDDVTSFAAEMDSDPTTYATRLLQYATICSMCGKKQLSDEVEAAYGFGMALLFDDAWKSLPVSCDNLIAHRNYLHAHFLSRHVMSQAAVSAAAFMELLQGALEPTDGGCAASLSLALLLCPCEEYTIENDDVRLEHVTLPDGFAEDFMKSLESSPPCDSNGRALQISMLLRVGMAFNWNAASELQWRHRAMSYYALVLTSNCPSQHLLLQTMTDVVISCADALPVSLTSALVFRTHQLCHDMQTAFGRNLLLQIGSCLKAGFVTTASIKVLLVNLLSVLDNEQYKDVMVTRTLVLVLAAANSVTPSILAADFPDVALICRSAQQHVLRSLAAADALGVFDVEIFMSVQLLSRLGATDIMITEGMLLHLLHAFDKGIDVVAVKCIALSLWHAFAPQYTGDAWFRCSSIVSRIFLHSDFSDLLCQHDIVAALADIVRNTITIDNWAFKEVMPRIAAALSSSLQYQSVILVRDFLDALLSFVPKMDSSLWCEEFVLMTSRCCSCNYELPDTPALRLSACRVILAICEQNASVVALSAVVFHLIEALPPCSTNSDSMQLLVRTMQIVTETSPTLLVDHFPSAILSIPLDVMDNLSVRAVDCVVQRKLHVSASFPHVFVHALFSHALSLVCIEQRFQSIR